MILSTLLRFFKKYIIKDLSSAENTSHQGICNELPLDINSPWFIYEIGLAVENPLCP